MQSDRATRAAVTRGEDDDVCNFLARWLTSEAVGAVIREANDAVIRPRTISINHLMRGERTECWRERRSLDAMSAHAGIALHCMHAFSLDRIVAESSGAK
jgi:hypothetical protein